MATDLPLALVLPAMFFEPCSTKALKALEFPGKGGRSQVRKIKVWILGGLH